MLRLTDHLELQRFLQSCHEVWNGGGRGRLPERPEETRGWKVADVGDPCPNYSPQMQLVLWRAPERTRGRLFCFGQRNLAVKDLPPPLQKGRVVLIVLGVFMREYSSMQP